MTQIAAIETSYAGCRFRSRLEARWAVFFDTLRIPWEYEPQGFELTNGDRYLPDFYLDLTSSFVPGRRSELSDRTHGIYVEVKGSDQQVTDGQRQSLAWMIDYQGPLAQGLLLLGPVPDPTMTTVALHSFLDWAEGVRCESVHFACLGSRSGLRRYDGVGSWEDNTTAPDWPQPAKWEAHCLEVRIRSGGWYPMRSELRDAYLAARSARFEHGETPKPRPVPSKPPTLGAVVRQQPAANAAREALRRARRQSGTEKILEVFGGSELVNGDS